MTYTCPICDTVSRNVDEREVWPRECGFFELQRNRGVSCACSIKCAIALLEILATQGQEIKPVGNGKPSKQWRCEQCEATLPQFIYQRKDAECETVPGDCPQIVFPYEFGKYHCFCSDKCLMGFLKSQEMVSLAV